MNGISSQWRSISAGVPQGSDLGPLFFLIHINDLVDNVNCDVKMFADDTSLFSTVTNETVTAEVPNRDLEKARLWAWQWKTEEVIFSTKRLKPQHPSLKLGDDEIANVPEHKHHGVILDSNVNFKSHIEEAVVKPGVV